MTRTGFKHWIGIDYSGAKRAGDRLPGLQVYASTGDMPCRVLSPESTEARTKNWSRAELGQWLLEHLAENPPTIVGIDHGLSFPQSYMDSQGISDWDEFLTHFVELWPLQELDMTVDDLRGDGTRPIGDSRSLRICETWTCSAKSVFQFDVQGSVAKSTFAGLPWLKRIRAELGEKVHFWPYDGFSVPRSRHVIAEAYPSLLRRRFPREDRTVDQQDAYAIARWLFEMDNSGFLKKYFAPPLDETTQNVARLEGWILGVM